MNNTVRKNQMTPSVSSNAFTARLVRDLRTHRDDGSKLIIPADTCLAVFELPAHYVTDMEGNTKLRKAGQFVATPDGHFWIDIERDDVRAEC